MGLVGDLPRAMRGRPLSKEGRAPCGGAPSRQGGKLFAVAQATLSPCSARSRPSRSLSVSTRRPIDQIDELEEDEGRDGTPADGPAMPLTWIRSCAGLPSSRPRAASPPTELDGEHAGEQGADDPADAMHAEHVERVVVAEHVLERGRRPEADDAGGEADHQGAARQHEAGGRGDRDQAGDGTRSDAEHAGLALGDPLHQHPGHRRRRPWRCGSSRRPCRHGRRRRAPSRR